MSQSRSPSPSVVEDQHPPHGIIKEGSSPPPPSPSPSTTTILSTKSDLQQQRRSFCIDSLLKADGTAPPISPVGHAPLAPQPLPPPGLFPAHPSFYPYGLGLPGLHGQQQHSPRGSSTPPGGVSPPPPIGGPSSSSSSSTPGHNVLSPSSGAAAVAAAAASAAHLESVLKNGTAAALNMQSMQLEWLARTGMLYHRFPELAGN